MQRVVERVLNLLIFLLEAPRPVTADEVRFTVQGYEDQSDEAFHRMFERDKDVLRRIGVPLKMEAMDAWEVEFGYKVDPEEYALVDLGLTDQERVALSLAARMVRLGGSYAGLDALMKLGGVESGDGPGAFGADLGRGHDNLGSLFAAVTERRKVSFQYGGTVRTVEPYGLAHRRGHWYLAGGTHKGERVYRVDRITGLTVDDHADAFRKPRKFDLRKAIDVQPWETGGGEMIEARVRFEREVAWLAARALRHEDPLEGEAWIATVTVSHPEAFVSWVLSFGSAAEILEPTELRAAVRDRIAGALGALR